MHAGSTHIINSEWRNAEAVHVLMETRPPLMSLRHVKELLGAIVCVASVQKVQVIVYCKLAIVNPCAFADECRTTIQVAAQYPRQHWLHQLGKW